MQSIRKNNFYPMFENSNASKQIDYLLRDRAYQLAMEKLIQVNEPPVLAFLPEAEDIFNDLCIQNSVYKAYLDSFKQFFGSKVGAYLESKGYVKKLTKSGNIDRTDIPGNKFFRKATRFIKKDQNTIKEENPFSNFIGAGSIGTMTNEEIDNTLYGDK